MAISKKQLDLEARYAAIQVEKKVTESPRPRVGMSSLMDYTGNLHDAKERLQAANAKIEVLEKKKVRISDLHEIAGRKRTLTPEAFKELKANLEKNPLLHAIVIQPNKSGGYDVIAGHNRIQAYRELGREEIEADIREFNEEEAFEAAFYSNLFNSPLSDYEKYLGFKEIQSKTNETQEELANRAGVSRSQITQLFSFDRFSQTAKNILLANPHVLGYTAAAKLAATPEDRILTILGLLVEGGCTEAQAVAMALRTNVLQPAKLSPIVIRTGKKTFAEIKVKGGLLAVTVKDENRVPGILDKIKALLVAESNNS